MKNLLLLFISLPILSISQQTYVPDDGFENALIYYGYDTILDDYVTTANINGVTSLSINNQNIADLTGIEAFTALSNLECENNNLISLDVSSCTALNFLYCKNNDLTSLNISGCTSLTLLDCSLNELTSLDVSNNTVLETFNCTANNLTSLDVNNNTALTFLRCQQNQLNSLDVSNCTSLSRLDVINNNLYCLNIKNGNNTNMVTSSSGYFWATYNPNLACIEVDDPIWSYSNWYYPINIDTVATFSINCNYPTNCSSNITSIQEKNNSIYFYPNPTSDHLMIEVKSIPSKLVLLDIQGKIIREEIITNKTHLMDVSALDKGIYFVRTGSFSSILIVE